MGMAMALEYIQEYLRATYGWQPNECGVQEDALPSLHAGNFYVAIDDAGVETGDERTDSLKEILNITIGIWRRPEHLNKNVRGNLKLPLDKYLLGGWTIAELEQKVKVHRRETGSDKKGLHNNWVFRSMLNTRYNLPDPVYGADFKTCLTYRGRGRMEKVAVEGTTDLQAWYGYRLRFRGLYREQKLDGSTDAIG